MTENFQVRRLPAADCADFLAVTRDAAARMIARGLPMWSLEELTEERLRRSYGNGLYVGYLEGCPAASMALVEADDFIWGAGSGEQGALYVHRLAVASGQTGLGLGYRMLDYAKTEALARGKSLLRLDTHAGRPKLRAFYENYGFRWVRDQVLRTPSADWQVAYYQLPLYELDVCDA